MVAVFTELQGAVAVILVAVGVVFADAEASIGAVALVALVQGLGHNLVSKR